MWKPSFLSFICHIIQIVPIVTLISINSSEAKTKSSIEAAQSDSKQQSEQKNETVEEDEENLPEIEANSYQLKAIRKSTTGKIYLLESLTGELPSPGKIVLLRKENDPIAAFRVLKTYADKKTLAGKRIKSYQDYQLLENHDYLSAIEKRSDILPPDPSQEDKLAMRELEKSENGKSMGSEPNSSSQNSSEATKNQPDESDPSLSKIDADVEAEEDHLAVTVEEFQLIDHYRNWLSLGIGYIKNAGPPSSKGSIYFSAGQFKYAFTLRNNIILNLAKLQDSIALEGGAYLYKAINFAIQNDSYTLASFSGTLRYNVVFSEGFQIFFYLGILRGYVISSSQGQASVVNSLNSYMPAGGGGFNLQLGPAWYARFDAGIDAINLSLMLRF